MAKKTKQDKTTNRLIVEVLILGLISGLILFYMTTDCGSYWTSLVFSTGILPYILPSIIATILFIFIVALAIWFYIKIFKLLKILFSRNMALAIFFVILIISAYYVSMVLYYTACGG